MKHLRRNYRETIARNSDVLKRLAIGLANSGSCLEDAWWEQQLIEQIDRLFTPTGQEALQATLDRLWDKHPEAYEVLADLIEARCEAGIINADNQAWNGLLFCAPVQAWSRHRIPTPALDPTDVAGFTAHLAAHVFAADAQIALANRLLSPDQLPFGFAATHRWARELFACAIEHKTHHLRTQDLAPTNEFMCDLRFIVGAVLVPYQAPVFRWQEHNETESHVHTPWLEQGKALVQRLLPGCQIELLMPGAFHTTCRVADRSARGFFTRAGVAYLQSTLACPADTIQASIAPFHALEVPHQCVEYRIGLTTQSLSDGNENGLQHGVVWPIFSEEEINNAPEEIQQELNACGVTDITVHHNSFPLEYCDDCGSPLFPTKEGETAHPASPEVPEQAPQYLH